MTENLFVLHRIAYVEFKTEADAEKMLEEAQGADVQGRSIVVDYVGEKSQRGAKVSGRCLGCVGMIGGQTPEWLDS